MRVPINAEAPPPTPEEDEGGDLAEWHERWQAESQDARATNIAHAWIADELEALGLIPQEFYPACGRTLCSVALGFEKLVDLYALRQIQPPPDVTLKTTLPFTSDSAEHVIIAHWTQPDAS